MSEPFRCAASGDLRGDELAGTASTVRAFLLVENPGPWGVDAVHDNRLPGAVKRGLAAAARDHGVRVNLVRRHRRAAPRKGFRVFAAHAGPQQPWLETTVLDGAEALLELDLAALGAGRSPGLDASEQDLLCVCTHGRHDACCAERGRPVAAALATAHPDQTWEISHIGGDRFAGNALFLPHGLYYGRLDAPSS
ncbi:MAG TPA: sucrase ferredoxin, partial [Nocardioides sp.]|nr:sucrase ferredoxin [Nocardioides sp.]